MAQQWPTTAPSVEPTIHSYAATQAYQAGGGDYFRSGYYSHGLFTSAATSTQATGTGTYVARPFFVPVRRAFDRIGVNVTVAATAGGLLRLGVHAHVDGMPGALILDAGTVASTATGAKEVVIALTLDPGIYWVGAVGQVAACTLTTYASATSTPWVSNSTSPPAAVADMRMALLQNSITGALPDPLAPTATSSVGYAVCLRAA